MKRKIYKSLLSARHGLLAAALAVFSGTSFAQTTYTFSYTGNVQTISLPAGNYSIQCWGADGGKGFHTSQIANGGKGGYSTGLLNLASAQTVSVYVGGAGTNANGTSVGQVFAGGFNGGGSSGANNYATASSYRAGGGGGASDIRVGGNAFTNRVIVAGGGGGGVYSTGNAGGNGGGASGGNGGNTYHGTGGSQTAGGTANGSTGNIAGTNGALGTGGNGGSAASKSAGGGGGGGYYGGGGGATGNSSSSQGAGGGGSGYIGGVTSGTTTMTGQTGFVTNPDITGNGLVLIKELCSISLTVTGLNSSGAMCAGNSVTITTDAISNYLWTNGSTASSLVVFPTTNTVYGLTATSPSNCTSSAQVSITVSAAVPNLTVTQTSNTINCVGEAVTFSASGAMTFTWLSGSSSGTVGNGVAYFPTASSNYTVAGANGCGIVTATTAVNIIPFTVSPVISTPTVCAGGSATLDATSPGNSYTWEPTSAQVQSFVSTPASSTIYTVIASNGTCITSGTIQLGVIALPVIAASANPSTSCSGAMVTLSVTGGSSYTWSPGGTIGTMIVDYPGGTTPYYVTGENSSGCVAGASVLVVVYPMPKLNVDIPAPAICAGGQAVLTAKGADTFSWSTGSMVSSVTVSPLQTTVYNVAGTNTLGNCSSNQNVLVTVITPTVGITGNTEICEGQTATLTASTGSALGYSWSTGLPIQTILVSPTVATIYVATATVAAHNIACVGMNSIQVNVNPNPSILAFANKLTLCVNESVIISASGGTSYAWSYDSQTSNSPSITITPTVSSNIIVNVTGTSVNGCTNTSAVAIVANECTGIGENGLLNNVLVYPNPSQGEINITFSSAADLQLFSETGQLIRKISLSEENGYKMSVSGLTSGVYFITGQNGTQRINKKIVVN